MVVLHYVVNMSYARAPVLLGAYVAAPSDFPVWHLDQAHGILSTPAIRLMHWPLLPPVPSWIPPNKSGEQMDAIVRTLLQRRHMDTESVQELARALTPVGMQARIFRQNHAFYHT
eukprot:6177997-Pleurochrysis_carterae.AAC.2